MRRGEARCRNYWVGHEKGHQFSRPRNHTGRRHLPLLTGEFLCTWDPERSIKNLYAEIRRQEGREIGTTFQIAAKRSRVRSVRSNRSCFTCLSQCPVYILPCEYVQHTICGNCAVLFNYSVGRSQATLCLKSCPLGCRFRDGQPWHGRIKPPTAGVRILSLDG